MLIAAPQEVIEIHGEIPLAEQTEDLHVWIWFEIIQKTGSKCNSLKDVYRKMHSVYILHGSQGST